MCRPQVICAYPITPLSSGASGAVGAGSLA